MQKQAEFYLAPGSRGSDFSWAGVESIPSRSGSAPGGERREIGVKRGRLFGIIEGKYNVDFNKIIPPGPRRHKNEQRNIFYRFYKSAIHGKGAHFVGMGTASGTSNYAANVEREMSDAQTKRNSLR